MKNLAGFQVKLGTLSEKMNRSKLYPIDKHLFISTLVLVVRKMDLQFKFRLPVWSKNREDLKVVLNWLCLQMISRSQRNSSKTQNNSHR
jgi:hypothetical protein